MQLPGRRHQVRRTQPAGFPGLFVDGLGRGKIVSDCRQYLFGVITELRFAHDHTLRDEGFREGDKIANDLLVMTLDENAQ